MYEFIPEKLIGKYPNIIHYEEILQCIDKGYWLKVQGSWFSPCEFVTKFGSSWFNPFLSNILLQSPYELLQEGRQVIDKKIQQGIQSDELNYLEKRYSDFKEKVESYYQGGWDQYLRACIEQNIFLPF